MTYLQKKIQFCHSKVHEKLARALGFLEKILPGLGFALAAHPYLPLLGSRFGYHQLAHGCDLSRKKKFK